MKFKTLRNKMNLVRYRLIATGDYSHIDVDYTKNLEEGNIPKMLKCLDYKVERIGYNYAIAQLEIVISKESFEKLR